MYRLSRFTAGVRGELRRIPPIVFPVGAFLCGIKCGYSVMPFSAAATLCAIIAVSAWAVIRFRRRVPKIVVPWLMALFFAAGALRSSDEVRRCVKDRLIADSAGEPIEIECRVAEQIAFKPLKGRSGRYSLRCENVLHRQIRHRFTLPVHVNWYGDSDASRTLVPAPGERWRFTGRIYPVRSRNRESYLVLNSGEKHSGRLRAARSEGIRRRLARFREDAARRITLGLEKREHIAELNRAVLLGSRENVPPSMKRIFACSGTIHVFAISGLHIALIASVFVFIISCCGLPRYHWVFAVMPLLIGYTMVTGMRPSAVRAALMAVFFFYAPYSGRRFNTLAALAAAALAVHLWRPAFIADIGSILSFSVMLGLVMLYSPLLKLLERVMRLETLRREAALYQAADEPARAERVERVAKALSVFAGLSAVTLAAWLSSMPLSAYFFGRITPGGLIANLLISPCAFMLIIAGVVGYAVSFVSSALAAVFNSAAGVFTFVMVKTAEYVSRCPLANFEIRRFPLWAVWAWFGMLLLLAWFLRRTLERGETGLEWIGDDNA